MAPGPRAPEGPPGTPAGGPPRSGGQKPPLRGVPQGPPGGPCLGLKSVDTTLEAPPNYDLTGPPVLICINGPWSMVIARVIYYGVGNVLIIYTIR